MIDFVDVGKAYKNADGSFITALKSVTCSLPDKGFYGIVGRSGSGKSTFLNLLGGMDTPTSGKIFFQQSNMAEFSESEMNTFRTEKVSYMFQEYNLITKLTALENVMLAVRFQNKDEQQVKEISLRALQTVGLGENEQREARRMSGGQQQRVAIARALAKNAEMILCDEPTGNLDVDTARDIMTVLKKVSADRLVVLVTHDRLLAEEFCDGIYSIDNGSVESSIETTGDMNGGTVGIENLFSNKRRGLSVRNIFRYSTMYLRRGLPANIPLFLVCTMMFVFLSCLWCISEFNPGQILYSAQKANGLSIFPVTWYTDRVLEVSPGVYFYGQSPEKVDVSKENELKNLVGNGVPIFMTYYFAKTLDDFSVSSDYRHNILQENWFREFVAVSDFNAITMELLAGNVPVSGNEVVISDYMAWNIVNQGKFLGINQLDDLVGYELNDRHTGLKLKITGILKSDWERLSAYAESYRYASYIDSYLASLQAVWGLEGFVSAIIDDGRWFSVEEKVFWFDGTDEIIELDTSPLELVLDTSDMMFLGEFNPENLSVGIILTKGQLAEYLRVPVGIIDDQYVRDHWETIKRMTFTVTASTVRDEIDRGTPLTSSHGVVGIVDDASTDGILKCYEKEEDGFLWYCPNGLFRQFYCALTKDAEKDKDWCGRLLFPVHTDEFYLSHKDYHWEGFGIYSPVLDTIQEAVDFLERIGTIGKKVVISVALLAVLGLLMYGILSVQKRRYEIGLFRSLGAGRMTVAMIFGTEMLMVVVAAALASIPINRILVNLINEEYTRSSIFSVKLLEPLLRFSLIPGLIGIGISVVAITISISELFFSSPAKLLKLGRN